MSVRMGCPFVMCSAVVTTVWVRPFPTSDATRLMVPWHLINHSHIKGGCPASYLWIPLTEEAAEMLTERAMVLLREVQAQMERQDELGPPERDRRAREGGVFPIRPVNRSGIPSRLGREPVTPEDQGDWYTPRPPEQYKPVPPTAEGHVLGSRSMASIREVVEQVTAGNVHTGEAAASIAQAVDSLNTAKAAIEQAKAQIAGAIDGSGAQTLGEYLGLLETAEQQVEAAIPGLEQAQSELAGGMERGETYIGMALG